MQDKAHVWRQLETLLSHARRRVILAAPFIKRATLEAAIQCVPANVTEIRCVTRWIPSEIAAGVSDPEIIQLVETDSRIQIHLCHTLHAKLYIADEACLVGSANLTAKALGVAPGANIEILVDVGASHPEIQRLMSEFEGIATLASADMAKLMREQAEMIQQDVNISATPGGDLAASAWTPITREPARLYQYYRGSRGMPESVRRGVLSDLAHLDLPAGLSEGEFNDVVRAKLRSIPGLFELLDKSRLRPEDLRQIIVGREEGEDEIQIVIDTLAAWVAQFEGFYRAYDRWELRQGRELR